MNKRLDHKIKQFETNVEEVIASAFKLQAQLVSKGYPNQRTDQMQCMAVSTYRASGNLLVIKFWA